MTSRASTPAAACASSAAASDKKRRGRGRPASRSVADSDGIRDVLFLKGAAAQQTTHPGNLAYYAMCEEKYEEYAALPDNHPSRAQICRGIIDSVLQSGGVFLSPTGGTMSRASAMQKTKDRMRQIAKPKIRPDNVNENDVVFTRGANNHLYAGNAKWRSLLDQFVMEYYRDFVENGMKDNGTNKRQKYQIDIINEVTSIVQERGGTFRSGDNLEALTNDEIIKKTHARFKDLKKELKRGKVFPQRSATLCSSSAASAGIKVEEASSGAVARNIIAERPLVSSVVLVDAERYVLRKTGCTSVKKFVKNKKDMKNLKKETKPKWRKAGVRANAHGIKEDKDGDEYDSSMLASDNDGSSDSDGEDSSGEEDACTTFKRLSKESQNVARSDRLKRRHSGQPASPLPHASKKCKASSTKVKTKQIKKEEEEDCDDKDMSYELSAYELLRLEKIKRNQQRLAELGLAGKFTIAATSMHDACSIK